MPAPSRLVTVLGWVTVALGLLGAIQGLVQVLMGLVVPGGSLATVFAPYGGPPPELPPLLAWYLRHDLALGVATLLVSALLGWIGLSLVRRRPWARLAFIAYVVLGTVLMFASLPLVSALMQAMFDAQFAQAGMSIPDDFRSFVQVYVLMVAGMFVVLALFHAWLVWKLCTHAIRAEFAPG